MVGWWLTLIVNLRLLHPEKQDSDDGDATTLIMMNEELWLSLLVLMSEGDDGDGDDHVGDDDVGDDDVGDENSYDLHDDLLFLSIAHPCLFSSSEETSRIGIVISAHLLSTLTTTSMLHLQW